MTTKRPYLDFYEEMGSQLVSRVVGNQEEFLRTRSALYMLLGIVPGFVKGKRVLELGPGTGHNSLHTARLSPKEYVLVDGGEEILDVARERLSHLGNSSTKLEFVCSLFENYEPDRQFDLVLAEACIPMQKDPATLLSQIAQHVKLGGVLVVTTISAVSYLSEILRRLGRDIVIPAHTPPNEQLEVLRPLYRTHLESLIGLGRSIDDWLLDNIVQPFDVEQLLTIPQAINVLQDKFQILGSSPKFLTDWRWHKTMTNVSPSFNKQAIESYHSQNINLMDYRVQNLSHDIDTGMLLETECSKIWDQMIDLENNRSSDWLRLWKDIENVRNLVGQCAPQLLPAVTEALEWLQSGARQKDLTDRQEFSHWWGRGQQYLSFVRYVN